MLMSMNRGVQYRDRSLDQTNPGCRLVDQYKLSYLDDGTETLEVCGKIDVYEKIQSYRDVTDIKAIIDRCIITQDMRELYKTEAFYADMTIMPKSRVDALKSLAEAQNVWSQLPADIKEKFDNDMNKFFASAFSEEWYKKLEIENVKSSVVEDVKVGETNE